MQKVHFQSYRVQFEMWLDKLLFASRRYFCTCVRNQFENFRIYLCQISKTIKNFFQFHAQPIFSFSPQLQITMFRIDAFQIFIFIQSSIRVTHEFTSSKWIKKIRLSLHVGSKIIFQNVTCSLYSNHSEFLLIKREVPANVFVRITHVKLHIACGGIQKENDRNCQRSSLDWLHLSDIHNSLIVCVPSVLDILPRINHKTIIVDHIFRCFGTSWINVSYILLIFFSYC